MTKRERVAGRWLSVESVVERKDPSLPRFIAMPSSVVAPWGLESTSVVDVEIGGVAIGRRSLKYWSERDAWFLNLTEVQCRDAGLDTGDAVKLRMALADESPPAEIVELLEARRAIREKWEALSPAQRRAISERVRAGKGEETRRRRASSALGPGACRD